MSKPCHFDKYGQLCILNVDDDQVNLMVMETLLRPQGWKILQAVDGTEAYAAVEESDTFPDLVFLDYTMPFGDTGEEICRKLRQMFGSTPVPIVMCTALSKGSLLLDNCLKQGASDYLLKPYERDKMLDKVQQHVGIKALKQVTPAPTPAAAAPAPLAPAAATATAPSASTTTPLEQLFQKLDLEYPGKKLAEAGITLEDLKTMDDKALRTAGIVVKSQRDKILEAAARLP